MRTRNNNIKTEYDNSVFLFDKSTNKYKIYNK